MSENVGKVFVDYKYGVETGDYRMYAVGETGFIDLTTGFFAQYGGAFSGPEFFDKDAFMQCWVQW